MNEQIRITANGGRKVRVSVIIKTKVASVIGLIHSLAQGAKQHGLNYLRIIALDKPR
jgi:hypothetical protein